MTRVVLSLEAERDLQTISDYTVNAWGAKQARRYLGDIFQAIKKLAENANLGHLHADIPAPYLVYPVGSHLIVYRLKDNALHVHYIPHSAMDLAARLGNITG